MWKAKKRVLVVGLARTGVAVSLFGASRGARVTGIDARPETEMQRRCPRGCAAAGVKAEFGAKTEETSLEQDLMIVSPGVRQRVRCSNWRVRGVFPFGAKSNWRGGFLRGKLIGITGSNGKTTTASLVAHILKTAAIETLLGGNIGTPLLSVVEKSSDSSVTVAEISSFQLESIDQFRPEIVVLLNLAPDHLDRHASFEEYVGAKMRMFENQLERDAAVLNADDPEVTRRVPPRPHIYWFSRQKRVAQGAFLLDGQRLFFATEGV